MQTKEQQVKELAEKVASFLYAYVTYSNPEVVSDKEIEKEFANRSEDAKYLWLERAEHLLKFIGYTKSPIKLTLPTIVCLCGSTRFSDAFSKAQLDETLKGKIVLTIGCNMKSDIEIFGHLSEQELCSIKTKLDELHKRKIDLADEVLILNVGGYIGESTKGELEYAIAHGKKITYLESPTRPH